ncbi:hypothetical protein HW532_02940 [Kaustia mangrovi]|uniref:Uncharacterized protein n=1 Tax=Kaustia mangrovi TaxID=2593653 RepID=A0A7S8HAS2_9HYPH|nr:DUF6665 family protein [Kaustia mangrovi]QPC41761.1 hypothetical protein HW532_02940 [Kaustia mangrovi]
MTVRPPRHISGKAEPKDPLLAVVEHEALEEKAATLSRLMTRLETALAALQAHDAAAAGTEPADGRDRLLAEAGEALWHVVIQRDLCGLRRHEELMRSLKVPPAVRLRMGPLRR